jgi:hypothetical protein
MHSKLSENGEKFKRSVPGPGQYTTQNMDNNRMRSMPKFSVGTSNRVDLGGTK